MPHEQTRLVDFKVNCISGSIMNAQIKLRYSDDTWLPIEYSGCDCYCGSDYCELCRFRVITMFFNNPKTDISEPITPVDVARWSGGDSARQVLLS